MLARRFSTLDHLTGGRIGWNIVTGYLNSAAKGIGLPRQKEHDTRYDIAEEYMQIVYKLWEGSWEVGAEPRIGIGNTLFPIPNRPHASILRCTLAVAAHESGHSEPKPCRGPGEEPGSMVWHDTNPIVGIMKR